MKKFFYFGLEPLRERYTQQLSTIWFPNTIKKYSNEIEFISIEGFKNTPNEIKIGVVLDAAGRGLYSMSQCSTFLDMIQKGKVHDGDIIYLQDFWTPGMESIFYTLDLYGIKNIKLYSMLHAQSVDEYDFTYKMRNWIRLFELGLDARSTGIFVGSSIHKAQLREAGFIAPIHVVSLPFDMNNVINTIYPGNSVKYQKENIVVFTSRFDYEKNPMFMIEVAKQFLRFHKNWEWHVTTSSHELRGNDAFVIQAIKDLAKQEPRFKLIVGLTKEEYYIELAKAKIQFNSSLQDYVSWTLLEATTFDCNICYPKFRSFPEIIPDDYLYHPFDTESALNTLEFVISNKSKTVSTELKKIAYISDLGRQIEGYIAIHDFEREINIWHEANYIEHFLNAHR